MDPLNRDLLNFRPDISFVAPQSEDVIQEIPVDVSVPKIDQIKQLTSGFNNVVKLSDAVEKSIDSRAGKFIAKLNPSVVPEDMVVAQAVARLYPDKAKEIAPGVFIVEEISYDMFKECVHHLEQYGKDQAKKSLLPVADNVSPLRTDFGGLGRRDNRPEINNMSAPISPLDVPAFIAAGIPVLFGMLFPLISTYVKTQVIGHTHVTVSGPPGTPLPSGPGISVLPV